MPLERCWRCKGLKPDVSLAPSDDGLRYDCYLENGLQLAELHRQDSDMVTPHAAVPSGANVGANGKTRPVCASERKAGKKFATKQSAPESVVPAATHQQVDIEHEDHTGPHTLVLNRTMEAELTELRRHVQAQLKSNRFVNN